LLQWVQTLRFFEIVRSVNGYVLLQYKHQKYSKPLACRRSRASKSMPSLRQTFLAASNNTGLQSVRVLGTIGFCTLVHIDKSNGIDISNRDGL
jgi:hypothetical protein